MAPADYKDRPPEFQVELTIMDWLKLNDVQFRVIGKYEVDGEKLMQVSVNDTVITTHADFWIDFGKELIKYGKKYR